MFKALFRKLFTPGDTPPEKAYNLWAIAYDNQPDNLMLALDEELFSFFNERVAFKNKVIVDVGCGTGRHWKKIVDQQPQQLTGYDVSAGMLQMLKLKFPDTITCQSAGNQLKITPDNAVDILISTLTIAHIKDPVAALREWNRVAKPGADIFISDYHPDILQKGGKRTFIYANKIMSVKNYIHQIEKIKNIASTLNWQTIQVTEKKIDEVVKHFYEKQGALAVYETYKGMPVIYGIHFKKAK